MTIDTIRAVTAEMRRMMPNACGDWADRIEAALTDCPHCEGAGEVYRANLQDPASPTVTCPQCNGTGEGKAPPSIAAAKLADRFWRIHPRELDAIGLTRQEFYAREIDALFAGCSEAMAMGAEFLFHYADYIQTVRADDLERHPYLPEIERVAAELRVACTPQSEIARLGGGE